MLAIIGGTGLTSIGCFDQLGFENVMTPYATLPVTVLLYSYEQKTVAFLPRHGKGHRVPPHKINYQANIWALNALGVDKILAVNAVGGIHNSLGPGAFAVPDQIIDYTWGRESSFFDDGKQGDEEGVTHVDFSYPFDEFLRQALIRSVNAVREENITPNTVTQDLNTNLVLLETGVYGCTQGPRLETAAEIRKLKQDGCDLVGMTAMPEAVLARELSMAYAMLALSVNWGAGMSEGEITMDEIHGVLDTGMETVAKVLQKLVANQDSETLG